MYTSKNGLFILSELARLSFIARPRLRAVLYLPLAQHPLANRNSNSEGYMNPTDGFRVPVRRNQRWTLYTPQAPHRPLPNQGGVISV
jgi:hypothetical protein